MMSKVKLKHFILVKKKFYDWFMLTFKKYYRVIIQSPIILSNNQEEDFIKWLEEDMDKYYIRYKRIGDDYIGNSNVKIYYISYFINKYDLSDFVKKVMLIDYDKEYPIVTNEAIENDVIEIYKDSFYKFENILKDENLIKIECNDIIK